MVPNGWEKRHLEDILSGPIRNGYSPLPAGVDTGYWILSLAALGDDGINLLAVKPVVPNVKVMQTLLKPGDFLVSRSNTPEKVGRSILFKGEIENCSYPDLMMRFQVDENKVDPLFIEQ
ncbi:TPA: restriction endonuclease subunit S, partial [Citrobacter koseri]|nr:restriction endonuclease subunit S [Citrobacter koseri]